MESLQHGPDLVGQVLPRLQAQAAQQNSVAPQLLVHHLLQALEVMLEDGWVRGKRDPTRPGIDLTTPDEGVKIHTNRELNQRLTAGRTTDQPDAAGDP